MMSQCHKKTVFWPERTENGGQEDKEMRDEEKRQADREKRCERSREVRKQQVEEEEREQRRREEQKRRDEEEEDDERRRNEEEERKWLEKRAKSRCHKCGKISHYRKQCRNVPPTRQRSQQNVDYNFYGECKLFINKQ